MDWTSSLYARSPSTSVSVSHTEPMIGVDGEQCGNAPTPALIPQIDMYVWTGGSLYFAM